MLRVSDMVQGASENRQSVPLAANVGLARPPAIYLIAILVGLVLHFGWPIRFVPNLARPFGGLIVVFAIMLFVWSIRTFRSAGTPVPGNQPTTAIVKVGPYRFSRNPIYLGFSLFQTGIALGVNDAWILITLLPAIALMSFVVIPREERYLKARFGEEYTRYEASVRRWL
jgi:protein-S-isoprenylcysteine O-methyltransferase Ste14